MAWFSASPSEAQYGSLYGTVESEQGKTLPGVAVSLRGMGGDRVAPTDDNGDYRFPSLDPGEYSLAAKLDGFSQVEQPNVIVALNRKNTIDFTLNSAVTISVLAAEQSSDPDRRTRSSTKSPTNSVPSTTTRDGARARAVVRAPKPPPGLRTGRTRAAMSASWPARWP